VSDSRLDPVELSRTRSVAHVSTAHLGHALSDDLALLMRSHVAVFVVDGYDIDLYPDAEAAAREIEGYGAASLSYLGADGTVYEATVEGPEWGPVRLHQTDENRLQDLVRLLRAEAARRALSLPPGLPDDPEVIWSAVLAAQEARRRPRRTWLKRHSKEAP
jgi:hypothetical protein